MLYFSVRKCQSVAYMVSPGIQFVQLFLLSLMFLSILCCRPPNEMKQYYTPFETTISNIKYLICEFVKDVSGRLLACERNKIT